MNSPRLPESVTLDLLDGQIVRSLQLNPRAPFRLLGDALGVAEQTINRRYRALHRGGVLRVVGIVDPVALGESDWIVRLRCRPHATVDVGRALAQRADIGWVSVGAGAELVCAVRAQTQRERERLLLDRLPRTAEVLEVTAAAVLKRFAGGSASEWIGLSDVLTPEQEQQVRRPASPVDLSPTPVRLDATDRALLRELAVDGRAPISVLARAADASEGRVSRRLARLVDTGILDLDVDLAADALGYPIGAYLWLSVVPSALDAVASAMATHAEAPFVAAVTGRWNAVAAITCRSLDHLYRYLTEDIAALDGITGTEVAPIMHRLKQAGSLMNGDRLAVPT